MPKFSRRSHSILYTCSQPLIELCEALILEVDFSVLCGFRDKEEQEEAFRTGRSTKRWPHSKHNKTPSTAVDLAPYPIDWQDTARFAWFAGYIMCKAKQMDIEIRWGGDWDRDTRIAEHRFIDMPHFEILEGG